MLVLSRPSTGICEWSSPWGQHCTLGMHCRGRAGWKVPAPTASSSQWEFSSFFPPPEQEAGRLPGLWGST